MRKDDPLTKGYPFTFPHVGVRGRGTQSSAERHFVSKGSPARPCVSVLDRSCRSPVSVRNAQGWAENSVSGGLPFRENCDFRKKTYISMKSWIFTILGVSAKGVTLRAKAIFGAPSLKVALNQRNIDGFGDHFPPRAVLGSNST